MKRNQLLQDLLNDERSDEEEGISRILERGLPVYIYGTENASGYACELLKKNGINPAGIFVDDSYLTEEMRERGILSYTEVMGRGKFDVVIGFWRYMIAYEKMEQGLLGKQGEVYFLGHQCEHLIDRDFFEKHIDDFEDTYAMLEDDLSKETMKAYLECRMNGRGFDLYQAYRKVAQESQYFDDVVLRRIGDKEVFVDCGVYNGDTIREFIKQVPNYKKIIGFDINQDNLNQMAGKLGERIMVVNKGIWSEETELYFSAENSASKISDDGDNRIQVTTIDETVQDEKVTFIKMDIEGSELAGLKGAYKTIVRCMPKLAICMYHRREDLITIPQYIRNIAEASGKGRYLFYLRHHFPSEQELVLYAIPEMTED